MEPFSDNDLPGELFENADYFQPFQCSPTACVACYFMTHSHQSHIMRLMAAHSIGSTGSERVCEVCQKLTCLPIDQPPPAAKELSMKDLYSANEPTNFQGAVNNGAVNNGAVNNGAVNNGAVNNPVSPSPNDLPRHTARHPGEGMAVNRAPDAAVHNMRNASGSHLWDASIEIPNLVTNLRSAEAAQMHRQHFMPYALPPQQATPGRQPLTADDPQETARRHQFERHQFERTFFDKLLGRNRHRARPKRSSQPEPATMATTYQVPTRPHSALLDAMATSVPFAILILMFSLGLVASVAVVSPSFALWAVVSDLIIACLRVLFVAVVFSTAIAFVLELSR